MKKGNVGGCVGIFVSVVLILMSVIFIMLTAGPVFGRLQYGLRDIYSLNPDEIKENRFVTIDISNVYGCFYTTYSTDSETGTTEVDNNYFSVPYTANNVLVIKTRPSTNNERLIVDLWSNSSADNNNHITLEGVLEKRSSSVRDEYSDWKNNEKNFLINRYDESILNTDTYEYVLDCSNTFTGILITFIIACVLLISVIVFWVSILIIANKGKNKPLQAYSQGSYIPTQTNSTPDRGATLPPQMNTFYPQSAQPQTPNMYTPASQPNAYQNNSYSQQNTYQNNPYNQQNTYQNNPYNQQNTYQNNSYNQQNTYQNNSYNQQNRNQNNPYTQQGGYNPFSQRQSNDPFIPPFNSIDRTNTSVTQQGSLQQSNNDNNSNTSGLL